MKTTIHVRIQGGLGNQLFQYAMGRNLALKKGAPLFLNTWEYHSNVCRKYDLERFNISAGKMSQTHGRWEIKLRRRRYAPLRRVLGWIQEPFHYRRILDKRQGFDAGLAALGGDLYLDGYWQSERYFSEIRELLLQELTFQNPPDLENADYLTRMASQNSVCVHLRRGDYVQQDHFNAQFGVCELGYYRAALAYLQDRVSKPYFYIFSDDPEWVLEHFPRLDRMTFVTHNVGTKDWEDLRLMMSCRHFIIANSTFSWWGAWLGKHPEKIVIAPKRWYASPTGNDQDLVPETWVRL